MLKCSSCHRWWHDHPSESGEWFNKKFPERRKILDEIRKQPLKTWRNTDFQEVYDYLKENE